MAELNPRWLLAENQSEWERVLPPRGNEMAFESKVLEAEHRFYNDALFHARVKTLENLFRLRSRSGAAQGDIDWLRVALEAVVALDLFDASLPERF